MRKNRATLAGLLAALATLIVFGTAAQDEPHKIGFVDIQQAILSTAQGKAAVEEFNRKQREAQAKVQPMIDRLTSMEEDLKAKKFVLSDDALFDKQLEMTELRNKIENEVKEVQGQLQIDERRLMKPLLDKMKETVDALGKEKGFTLIIQRGAPQFLYVREALDITDDVVKQYNAKG